MILFNYRAVVVLYNVHVIERYLVNKSAMALYGTGQIELYTHLPIMSQLVEKLHSMNFYVCGVFLVDSQFLIEVSKFISGVLSALSAMVSLQIPHVNVMTKLDLLSKKSQKDLERFALCLCFVFC